MSSVLPGTDRKTVGFVVVATLVGLVGALTMAAPAAAQSNTLSGVDGSGTAEDPYVITNATELQAVDDDLDAHYVLGDDVDASETADWNAGRGFEPIAFSDGARRPDESFSGVFDGQNHTVEGLTIRYPDHYRVGLFGRSDGVIRNLHVADATVEGDWVGVVLGVNEAEGVVAGVSATGEVSASGFNAGGVVGINNAESATVTGSWAAVEVSSRDTRIGGLVGRNIGQVEDSYATGSVRGRGVGGLVGANDGSTLRAYATSSLSELEGDFTHYGGGIAAQNDAVLVDGFWDVDTSGESAPVGGGTEEGTGLSTAEMTGPAASSSMAPLVSGDAWITTDSYPKLARNVEGLSAEFDEVLIAGNESELSAWLALVGDRTEGVVSVADYESDDSAVATVEDGVVTGHEAGQASITVSHAGETATTDVVVVAAEGISPAGAELDATEVSTGDTVTVTGTLRNVDENATYRNVSLQVDGETVTTANVTVDGDAEATHTFEWTPESAGNHDLAVGGIDAGTLQVTDPAAEGGSSGSSGGSSTGDSGGSGGATDGGSGDLPVTLAAGSVLAAAVLGLLARRRR